MNSLPPYIYASLLAFCFLYGCETPFEPDTAEADQQYVVEGFVEAGDQPLPTYVIITRSIPFIGEISPEVLNGLFVRGATVTVDDGDNVVPLPELCLNELPAEVRTVIASALGFDPDSSAIAFCAYVDVAGLVTQEQGRTYDLTIELADGTQLTASTTVPSAVPLSNLRWEDPPGDPNDTMATLKVTLNDPADEKNYYRYFTAANGGRLFAPFASVVDDGLFNGEEFEIPLNQAIPRNAEFDPSTGGLWTRGDSIEIKWCTIDKAHFDFWQTFDFNNNNQGPFSSYTRVSSNVDGALGIWGGYAVSYYEDVVVVE